jgi:hypothetical protein
MGKGADSFDRLREQHNALIAGGGEDSITNKVPFRIPRLLQNRESEIDQLLEAEVVNIRAEGLVRITGWPGREVRVG